MLTDRNLFTRAIRDLSGAVEHIDGRDVDRVVSCISNARQVSVFGCGGEGLQIRGFAMRLFHLGRSVSVVRDMTTPAITKGDLLLVTAGSGTLSSALALVGVAKAAGAHVLTAEPEGPVPKMSDEILVLPAQTMASDHGENISILPTGSVYEGALFVLFEVIILKLKSSLKVTDQVMRSNESRIAARRRRHSSERQLYGRCPLRARTGRFSNVAFDPNCDIRALGPVSTKCASPVIDP